MHIRYFDAGEIDNKNAAGWYAHDRTADEYHGPFFSREAAADEALILEREAEYERRIEARHNRSLMYPGV